jgi:phage terminase large subunit
MTNLKSKQKQKKLKNKLRSRRKALQKHQDKHHKKAKKNRSFMEGEIIPQKEKAPEIMRCDLHPAVPDRWLNDPLLFCEEAVGITLRAWQKEAFDAFLRTGRLAIRSGHGVGKTTFLCLAQLWFILTRPDAKVVLTSPTLMQMTAAAQTELFKWYLKMPDFLQNIIELRASSFTVNHPGGSSIVFIRASNENKPESFQGFHSAHVLIVIDEASGVGDVILESAMGSLTSHGAKLLLCGNPTRKTGFFHRAFHQAAHSYTKMKIGSMEIENPSQEFRQSIIDNFGLESDAYRIRVLGEFPAHSGENFINEAQCSRAFADDERLLTDSEKEMVNRVSDLNLEETGFIGVDEGYDPLDDDPRAVEKRRAECEEKAREDGRNVENPDHYPVIWGIDVARFGNDQTAIAKRRGPVLLEVKYFPQCDLVMLSDLIYKEYENTPLYERPQSICIDVIGLGVGLADMLDRTDLPIEYVNVAERPVRKASLFSRRRDELWGMMQNWLYYRAYKLPDHPVLKQELFSMRYMIEDDRHFRMEQKQQLKSRLGRSPDLADSLALTFAVYEQRDEIKYRDPATVTMEEKIQRHNRQKWERAMDPETGWLYQTDWRWSW